METEGVTWQRLTQLMQLANAAQKKAGRYGICFGGKRSNTNVVCSKIGGAVDWRNFGLESGVYLVGALTAVAGHMFVLHATDEELWVHDSMEKERKPFSAADFSWVIRWQFVRLVIIIPNRRKIGSNLRLLATKYQLNFGNHMGNFGFQVSCACKIDRIFLLGKWVGC